MVDSAKRLSLTDLHCITNSSCPPSSTCSNCVFYEVEALADGHKQQQHWQQEPRQDSGLRGMHKLEQIAPLVSKERGTWLDSGEYDADADADPDSDEANGLAQPPPDILCRCKCTCGALSQASSLARRYRRPATPAYCRQQRRYKAELSSRIEPLASDGGTTPEDNHLDSHRYRRQLHSASAQPPPVATKPVLHLDDSMLVPTRPSPFINNISSTTASTCEAPKYDMVSNTIGGGGGGVVGSTSAVAAAAVDRKYNCDGCSNVATTATWSCPVSSSLSSSPLRRDSVRVEMNQIGSLNDLTRSASAGPPAWNSRQVGGPTRLDMMIAADHRQHHQALGEPRTIWSIAPATAPARHYSANQLPSSWRFAPKSLSASAAVPLLEHVLPPAGRRYQSQCVKLNDCKSSLAASSHFQLSTSGRRRDTMSRRDNENCSDNGADNAPPSTFKSIKNQCYLGGWSQQQQSTDVPISAPRPPTRACSHQQQCHNPILVGYHSDNALAANSDDQFGAQAATGGREKLLSLSGEQGANNYEDAWTLAGKTSSVVGGEGGGRDDNNVSGEESAIQQGRVCSLRVRICMPNTAKVERIFIERRPNVNYIQRLEPPANETSREPASYAN